MHTLTALRVDSRRVARKVLVTTQLRYEDSLLQKCAYSVLTLWRFLAIARSYLQKTLSTPIQLFAVSCSCSRYVSSPRKRPCYLLWEQEVDGQILPSPRCEISAQDLTPSPPKSLLKSDN
jgi:hypothetical protein